MELNTIIRTIVANRRIVTDVQMVHRDVIFDDNMNYVVIGMRQAGKSYLLYQRIAELMSHGTDIEEIIYLNFDDERLIGFTHTDFDLILQAQMQLSDKRPILFLDELQNIEHWENFARRLANEKYRVYITGSNSRMLSSEIATTLGGRFMTIDLFPFSLKEFLSAKGIELQRNWEYDDAQCALLRRAYDEYFRNGGFPESCHLTQKRSWLSTLYQKIFFGDLIARYKVRNDNALRLLIKKMAESVKQPTSYSRLTSVVSSAGTKVQTNTIIDFIGYLRETWLIISITNYAAKFAEKETQKKYYFRDNGILNLFLLDPETSLLENAVAIELVRRHGDQVYFYNKNVEVDFYLPEAQRLIQVSYSIEDEATRSREVESLIKVAKVLQCKELQIITMQEERVIEHSGLRIEVWPIWKWILLGRA